MLAREACNFCATPAGGPTTGRRFSMRQPLEEVKEQILALVRKTPENSLSESLPKVCFVMAKALRELVTFRPFGL